MLRGHSTWLRGYQAPLPSSTPASDARSCTPECQCISCIEILSQRICWTRGTARFVFVISTRPLSHPSGSETGPTRPPACSSPLKKLRTLWRAVKVYPTAGHCRGNTVRRRRMMLEVRKHAMLAGRALRVYTTHRCGEHIKRVLESGSLSELHDAMLFIRAAFGYQSETLSLVKCEEECRRDSDGPCLLKEIG